MFPLTAPLIVIDLETTGLHKKVDRIVQIALIKLYPDGKENPWSSFVNPGIPIPPEVTETHKITDETVRDSPTFAKLAPELARGFEGCDFAGYNVWFDLGFLEAEFARLTKKKIINGRVFDAYDIYRHYYPRTLTAAVEEYMGVELNGAHDAAVDVRATLNVIEAQLRRHPDLPQSIEEIHRKFSETPQDNWVDPDGKCYWRYGEATINFGDKAGTKLRDMEPGYLRWILNKEFPEPFKQICRDALEGVYPKRNK